MPNKFKIDKVNELSQKVQNSSSITFFEYKNIGANIINDLRIKAKDAGAELVIAKNTLVKIALGSKIAEKGDLKGQTGVLFSFTDSISPIKSLFDFSKKCTALKIKGAFIDNSYYDSAKLQLISSLPTRAELVARMLAGFRSPVVGFVNVISGTRSKFTYAISAIVKKREVGE